MAEFLKQGNHVYKKKMRGRQGLLKLEEAGKAAQERGPGGCFWNHSIESGSLHFLMEITEQLPVIFLLPLLPAAWRVMQSQAVWVNMVTAGKLISSCYPQLGCDPVGQESHFCLELRHRLQLFSKASKLQKIFRPAGSLQD